MKKELLLASFLTAGILLPSPATAAVFSTIYSFGDSLSDNGNVNQAVLQATGGTQTFPPSPPYDGGRFSNGLMWTELLAQQLGIPLVNFAFGGATTGSANTLDNTLPGIPLPGLEQQINNFVFNTPVADPNALYTIWVGANDYLPTNSIGFTPVATPTIPLTHIQEAVNSLVGIGAEQIMILNLPNLGEVPRTSFSLDGNCPVNNQFDADCLNDVTIAHNNGLVSLFSGLPPEVNIIPVDINSLVSDAIENPAQFGLTNVTDGCFNQITFAVCSNPDEYLFWDSQHPSATGHQLIAQLAFQSLGIPEPSAIAGLVAMGLMAVGTRVKGKR